MYSILLTTCHLDSCSPPACPSRCFYFEYSPQYNTSPLKASDVGKMLLKATLINVTIDQGPYICISGLYVLFVHDFVYRRPVSGLHKNI